MSEKGGKFMGKRICVMAVVILTSFCVTACNKMTKDDLVWTNENIVYAYVNAGYEDDILKDLEGSFESLSFQKVYAAEKNTNEYTPLSLLFILDENGAVTQREFIGLLEQDERISYADGRRDLPFETVDTRYIEREKDTVSVGETLQLTLVGNIDYYVQPLILRAFS